MPCSNCRQSGHNLRTCDDVSRLSDHQRIDEPVNQLDQSSTNIVEPVINDIIFNSHHIRNPTSRSPSTSPSRSPSTYEIYSPIPHILSGYNTPTPMEPLPTDHASLFTPAQGALPLYPFPDIDLLPIHMEPLPTDHASLFTPAQDALPLYPFPDIDLLPTQLLPDDDLLPTQLFPDDHLLPTQLFPDDDIITGLARATNVIHPTPVIKTLVQIVDTPCHIDECPICMEDLLSTDTFTTRCGHMFHGTCMLIHTKLHDSCPMCRGILIN